MGKMVSIADTQALRLEQLATTNHTTESALVEQALDMLFRQSGLNDLIRADWEQLRQMEAEGVSLPPHRITAALDPAKWSVTHAVPVPPENLRRSGDAS